MGQFRDDPGHSGTVGNPSRALELIERGRIYTHEAVHVKFKFVCRGSVAVEFNNFQLERRVTTKTGKKLVFFTTKPSVSGFRFFLGFNLQMPDTKLRLTIPTATNRCNCDIHYTATYKTNKTKTDFFGLRPAVLYHASN